MREHAIEWWFAIPPVPTNVSALLGETWASEIVFSSDSVELGIRRSHPHRRIEMKFCMVAGLQEVVLSNEFHQIDQAVSELWIKEAILNGHQKFNNLMIGYFEK